MYETENDDLKVLGRWDEWPSGLKTLNMTFVTLHGLTLNLHRVSQKHCSTFD